MAKGTSYSKDSVTSSGTNDQGNHYCTRENSATGSTGYHYSNNNGSYYYQNTNSSTYYDSGTGYSQYTSPGGQTSKSYGN